ncbi:molybdotransferase-like divisome protein Glp [Actinoallomurus rhizosphaericola]|uniref:molybdotransferase-like divisome protein Glp n=1 Tax=Actinoallomurus rhizosphaericola TaxID=2952536 RepID=UPI0020905A72|nr:gephyrin-like molybdotransferase Glp [Actinoallomurus rhizosphaericola]MCO5992872.1 molybdopterin molybdotransferase MoeA [Actinoallomurus rhizosphaericola]
MKRVDEHLADILGSVRELPPLELALPESLGGVLAEPVTAPVDLPPFDNSAMDGYAVLAADVAAASETSPVSLSVVGDIAAGDQGAYDITPGRCARIMTGAPLPGGADAIVPVEWTDGGAAKVTIRRPATPGHYIRRAGEDVTAGQTVLPAGTRLGAAQVGMLAAVGRARVLVRPRPRVAVLSTGSELVEPGSPVGPGQIWDSNSFALTAAVTEAGGVGFRVGSVGDDPREVLATIQEQLASADVIITSGGVSMGAYDVVKEVLSGLGTMRFEKVAMRPGKPQGFGLLDDRVPVFTLPGNPVSAFVSFQVFVRPALRALQGLPPAPPRTVRAPLRVPIDSSPEGLRHYLRANLGEDEGGDPWVAPAEAQGSHQVFALSSSNALIVVPEDVTSLQAGQTVDVLELP